MNHHLAIIPLPDKLTQGKESFSISEPLSVTIDAYNQNNLVWLQKILRQALGFEAAPVSEGGQLQLSIDGSLTGLGEEGYQLTITTEGIDLRGLTETGIFYGLQSLSQMLPPGSKPVADLELPAVEIIDRPRYPWRGFMLDEGRHFQGMKAVKRLLDVMAALKMNIFHWHLTEDQGWRIEIKKYPRLTEVGSQRAGTAKNMWGMLTGQHDGVPHGGFYTQDQIRDIVSYAADRHITIVPEIEMPGHSVAALAAYPEFSCRGEPLDVRTAFGISKDIYCVGNEGTFIFLAGILEEVIDLFPGKFIHLGGDEAPRGRWQDCPKCQQRMVEQGFSETRQLHSYLINRMAAFLTEHGREAVGWNENLIPGLNKNFVIQYWFRGEQLVKDALQAGRRVVFSPYLDYYLDHSYRLTPLSRTYAYQPGFPELGESAVGSILGVVAPLWTEWVPTQARLDYQVFPRLLAVAETAWTPQERKDPEGFTSRYLLFQDRLRAGEIGFASDAKIEPGWRQRLLGLLTIAQRQNETFD